MKFSVAIMLFVAAIYGIKVITVVWMMGSRMQLKGLGLVLLTHRASTLTTRSPGLSTSA